MSVAKSNLANIKVRRSSARGHSDHGWLNTYHTFSFAHYQDDEFTQVGSLRVLNEDRVEPGSGFGKHSHANYEIFSYIVSGELTHRDSLGNLETLKRGDVQFTSAGRGISHSEFNENQKDYVHFLQMWVKPTSSGLEPRYATANFSEDSKRGKLVQIVSSDGADGSIPINQDIRVFATILDEGQEVTYELGKGRKGYIHVIQDTVAMDKEKKLVSVDINGTTLKSGDGAFLTEDSSSSSGSTVLFTGKSSSTEILFFDIADTQ